MKKETVGPILSAVFVDYDNVYLSLQRQNEEAARRFAKHSRVWVDAIASGTLVTQTKLFSTPVQRRLVMNRCYGNTVPRRNAANSETDMNSFAFVRHNFLQSGFEIVDCPPLNGQQKNSSDIRMVMDIRDYLDHKTEFDEFIILSSDADFTPVLHRLRAHAKRTVIFTSENTAAHYTALSDGEVRENNLIACLLGERLGVDMRIALPQADDLAALRHRMVDLVVQAVLEADFPLPLETLEERTVQMLGYDNTVGTNWGGAGSLHDLLSIGLPDSIELTGSAPYYAFDTARVVPAKTLPAAPAPQSNFGQYNPDANSEPARGVRAPEPQPGAPKGDLRRNAAPRPQPAGGTGYPEQFAANQAGSLAPQDLQDSISRIHAACEAPPFSPPEYRAIFALLEQEISENQFQGVKTLQNVARRATEIGIKMSADDARYLLDAVTQGDPWLEQGASASLFARRFRDYVVKRCKNNGLSLTGDELELIDAWFVSAPGSDAARHQAAPAPAAPVPPSQAPQRAARPGTLQDALAVAGTQQQMQQPHQSGTQWWSNRNATDRGGHTAGYPAGLQASDRDPLNQSAARTMPNASPLGDDFPRIVRSRLRS